MGEDERRGRDETSRAEIKGLSKLAKPDKSMCVCVCVCVYVRLKFRMTAWRAQTNRRRPTELNKHRGRWRRWLRRCFRAEFERVNAARASFSPFFPFPPSLLKAQIVRKGRRDIAVQRFSLQTGKLGRDRASPPL